MNDDTDILRRGLQAADNLRNATHQLSASWIAHKIAMYRDISLISAVILTGLVVFVGPDDVTWPFPYYAAIAAFVVVIALSINLIRGCVQSERRRLAGYEAALARLSSAIRTVEVSPTPDTTSLLAGALSGSIEGEAAPGRLQRTAERVVFWFFIAALLGAFAGLMFDPSAFRRDRDAGPDVMTTSYNPSRV